LKIYLYFFRAFIGIILLLFIGLWWVFSSSFATRTIVEKLGEYSPIHIERISGNLQDGIQIQNLNHPDFSLQKGEILINWSALLRSKLHIKNLSLEGLHVKESALKNRDNQSDNSSFQIPLKEYQIDSLHVSVQDLRYESHTLSELKLKANKLYYTPKIAPRGDIYLHAKSSLGDIDANASLDKIIKASGRFSPKELPDGITLNEPVDFVANGDTEAVYFELLTKALRYDSLDYPLLLQSPQILGSYNFQRQSLDGNITANLKAFQGEVAIASKFQMRENKTKTLAFWLDASTAINGQVLKTIASSFDQPILETFALDKPISLSIDGNQTKINYTLLIPHFSAEDVDLTDIKIKGQMSENFIDGTLASNLKAAQIPTALEGDFKMSDFDINSLYFSLQGQSNLEKYMDSNLFSQISGNLEKIDFITVLEPTIYEDYTIDELIIKGEANKESLNFDLQSALKYDENSLHVKIPQGSLTFKDMPIKLAINPQIKLNNEPLIFIQNPQLLLTYEKTLLDATLFSDLFDVNATYEIDGKARASLHVKSFEPSKFITLPEQILINAIEARGEVSFDKSIDANLALLLDKTTLNLKAKGPLEDLKMAIWHKTFEIEALNLTKNLQGEFKIASIEDFIMALNPHINQEIPKISGSIDGKIALQDERLSFLVKSDSLVYEEQSLHNITIQGEFKDQLITLTRLNFALDAGLGLSSMQSFSLIKPATFNTQTTDLSLDFKGLSLKAVLKPQLSLHVNTDEFFLAHPLYGEGMVSGIVQIDQEDENYRIGGEVNAKNIKAHYKPSGFSIHTDKDIIMVDHNSSKEEDFFTQNIALDLVLIIDDVHYKQDQIDLKTSGIFYLKKEPKRLLEFYGSVLDITGDVVTLGKKFDILASNIYFRGYNPIDPALDILALYKHQETDITIRITGTQSNPRVYLSSNPLMPQRDIFSILIFGTRFGSSDNPHTQQSRASQASLFLVNELSKDYVKALGLDVLMFEYNSNSGTIDTTIGKEVSDETTLMLKSKSEGGSVIIQQKLSPKWKVELGIGNESQSIDIIHKKKY